MTEKLAKLSQDTLLLGAALLLALIATIKYDLFQTLTTVLRNNHDLPLTEILLTLLLSMVLMLIYVIRRFHELGNCRCRLLNSLTKINNLSTTDRLTGLYNRRYFTKLAERDIDLSLRAGLTPYLLLIDIDHFDSLTNAYGEHASNRILQLVGQRIIAGFDKADLAARYREQTFIVLLPASDRKSARQRAEHLCQEIFSKPLRVDHQVISTSVSIGIGARRQTTHSLADLIETAELALYEAKDSGRNRVILN